MRTQTQAKRVTFPLHVPALDGIEELVRAGYAPSKNALIERLVEEALRKRRRELREQQALEEYRQAFSDPVYRAEQEEILRQFARADAETARLIDT